jgi:hypothetical protein
MPASHGKPDGELCGFEIRKMNQCQLLLFTLQIALVF